MTIAIHTTGEDETVETVGSAVPPAPETKTPPPASPPPAPPTVSPSTNVGANGLPEFERVAVSRTEIKISGTTTVDTRGEVTVGLDDRLRICGEFRVVKVLHYVDKNGDVVRQQVIAPIDDLDLVPWDSSNPLDEGILRAH